MANVAHSTLTGSELHEPKGVETASAGEVYVADGGGSGSWTNVGTSSFTGMIADFAWPVVQEGWLECDGSTVSTSTYANLYNVMTIQTSGTRTNGSAVITSVPSTSTFKVGYYIFGAGIASGTTILSIDSATQITLSGNASSSGTSAFVVSPWLLNTGTIKLPDLSTAGRYRRSRTATTAVGQTQADQNKAHTHGVSGTTANQNANHTHTFSGNTGTESAAHTHTQDAGTIYSGSGSGVGGGGAFGVGRVGTTGTESANHTHAYSGTTSAESANHAHTFSVTSASDGGTEARPLSIVVMTCVKT